MRSLWTRCAYLLALCALPVIAGAETTAPDAGTAAPAVVSPGTTAAPVIQEKAASETMLFGEYMSMDQVLQQRMAVSTLKETTPREAPNVVTLITADQIADTGARDLMDVLRLVPGFEFGVDVSGVVGLAVRGQWAHEGKVLFLLDGQIMNEIAYGTLAFGNHFPVEQIKRIEIIRGPGSAVYGGYAELGVINVITKNGKDLDGAEVTGTYSQMSRTYSHRNLQLSAGKQIEDLDVAAHVLWGQGNRSEGTYTSMGGETYDMATAAQLNPMLVNFGMKYKGLEFRTILDQYRTTERDWWGADLPMPVRADFNTRIIDAKYDWKAGALTLTPRITFKEQEPYQRNGVGTKNILVEGEVPGVDTPSDHLFEIWMKRQTESLTASYDFSERDNVLAGIEGYQEQGETISDAEPQLLQYNNLSAFAQGLVDLTYLNLTAGARFERHNKYGNSFVPRVGLTSLFFDPLHVKLLFSKAFRVPQLETIVLSDAARLANPLLPEIKPETSTTLEFETGYQVSDKSMLTVNLFDTLINDVIIYFATAYEYQLNSGAFGNRGAELSYEYRDAWGFVTLGYTYNHIYKNEGFNHPETNLATPSIYWVPGHDDRVVGLPNQKVTLNANFRVLDQLSVNPSLIWFNQRYGYTTWSTTHFDDQGNMLPEEFAAAVIANLFVSFAATKELHVGVGVNDITNSSPVFLQAYNGYHAPIPSTSRSYIGKVSYDVAF
jgi:outer membrane cobalamin receptor